MKKFVLLLVCVSFISIDVFAQESQKPVQKASEVQETATRTIDAKYRERISKLFDAKIYHDPYIVSNMLASVSEKKTGDEKFENVNFETFFTKQDELRLKNSVQNLGGQKATLKTDPVSQKVWISPQESYIDVIMNQEIPVMKKDDVNDLSKMDKTTLSNFTQMMTESGPELGRGQVAIQYDNS